MKTPIRLRALFVMAAIAISTSAVASAQYQFNTFQVPGSTSTFPQGISNDNQIVGYYVSSSGITYGFSYSPGTNSFKYPLKMSGALATEALAVNNAGTIVGNYTTSYTSGYFGMIDTGGQYVEFQEPGCSSTQVTGINDYGTGTTTGFCTVTNPQGPSTKEAWVGSPWYTTFSCNGASQTLPAAINNWAIVGGTYVVGVGDDISQYGFVSTTSGDCQQIVYPNAAYTAVGGLNDTGTITGTWWPYGSSSHGFVIVGSAMSSLDVPGSHGTMLNQVNNNGWIVGVYYDGKNVMHGFYAVPINGKNELVEAK